MNGVFVASTYPLNSILIFEAVSHSPNTPTMGIKTNEDLEADYVRRRYLWYSPRSPTLRG